MDGVGGGQEPSKTLLRLYNQRKNKFFNWWYIKDKYQKNQGKSWRKEIWKRRKEIWKKGKKFG